MKYLLDTNTCIRYWNGRSENIRKSIASMNPQDIFLCSVVKAELFYGSMKSLYPEKNLARQKKFVDQFVSLPRRSILQSNLCGIGKSWHFDQSK